MASNVNWDNLINYVSAYVYNMPIMVTINNSISIRLSTGLASAVILEEFKMVSIGIKIKDVKFS